MRKLIVQQWVTVDNIAAEEDGGLRLKSLDPFLPWEQGTWFGRSPTT
jgi:hypothetical protein